MILLKVNRHRLDKTKRHELSCKIKLKPKQFASRKVFLVNKISMGIAINKDIKCKFLKNNDCLKLS